MVENTERIFPCKGEVHGIKPCSNPTAFNESFAAKRGVLRKKWDGGEVSQICQFLLATNFGTL